MPGAMDVVARLANSQRPAYPHGDIIPKTLAKPKDFAGLSMFLQSGDQQERLSASDTIKTPFDFQVSSSAFGPKVPGSPHRDADGGEIEFLTSQMTEYEWTKKVFWHEIHLQGNSVLSPENSQRLWSILQKKEKDFVLHPLLEMEKDIFATPSAAMFDGDSKGLFPLKSLWTGVNIWDTTHGVTGEGLFPGMTTQQGLDPEDARFARVDGFGGSQLAASKVTYAKAGTADTTTDDHILERMDYLVNLLGWEPVPLAGEFADGAPVDPKVAYCSREAIALYQRTNRAHDSFFATIPPFGDPAQARASFRGMSLMPSDSIRNSLIYPDITSGATVADAVTEAPVNEFDTNGNAGPVFYFFDPSCVNLWMHTDRAWETGPWKSMAPINEDVMRRLGKSVMQLHFESYPTSGILHPSADIAGYGAMS